MEYDENILAPTKSVLWASPNSQVPYLLFIERPNFDHMPPGIENYNIYTIGNFTFTIALADRHVYTDVVGQIAAGLPETEERFLIADSYMKLMHISDPYAVIVNRQDSFLISDILAAFPNKDAATAYFKSLTQDIEAGDISLVSNDGVNIFRYEGPALLPVSTSPIQNGLTPN